MGDDKMFRSLSTVERYLQSRENVLTQTLHRIFPQNLTRFIAMYHKNILKPFVVYVYILPRNIYLGPNNKHLLYTFVRVCSLPPFLLPFTVLLSLFTFLSYNIQLQNSKTCYCLFSQFGHQYLVVVFSLIFK